MLIDEIDVKIIELLMQDSRTQWKTIGEQIHMTGQAVAARIRKMEDMGIIEGFTLRVNPTKMGLIVTAFITVFMKSPNHQSFFQFIETQTNVEEVHRVTGEGCYFVKANFPSHDELNEFLDQLLMHANYRVSISLKRMFSHQNKVTKEDDR